MEAIIAKLLQPDNSSIAGGTRKLKEAFSSLGYERGIGELGNIMLMSENPQIRNYAAVILRRQLTKSKCWKGMSDNLRSTLKVSTDDTERLRC